MNYKVKVINLARRTDRWQKFQNAAQSVNLCDFERFDAVDGSVLEPNDKITQMFKNNTFGWRRGVVGTCLSHIGLWRELIASNSQYYVVFEDDVIFRPLFTEYYGQLLEKLKSATYPFIFMDYTTDREHLKTNTIGSNSNLQINPQTVTEHIWGGIFAYVIHRDFAAKMLSEIDENGMNVPADTFILNYPSEFCDTWEYDKYGNLKITCTERYGSGVVCKGE